MADREMYALRADIEGGRIFLSGRAPGDSEDMTSTVVIPACQAEAVIEWLHECVDIIERGDTPPCRNVLGAR